MIRKIFCYVFFVLELVLLVYVSCCFSNTINFNYALFVISIVMLISNIPTLIISFLLFGAPSNNYDEYIIKYISYNDIIKGNRKLKLEYKNGVWQFFHRDKYYKFDLRGWPNVRKRVLDMIFIQYHNNYCDAKMVKNKDTFHKKGGFSRRF